MRQALFHIVDSDGQRRRVVEAAQIKEQLINCRMAVSRVSPDRRGSPGSAVS